MTWSPSPLPASKHPPLLSHIFHWKFKWYSMLPIASPSCFFIFFFCHASVLCCSWRFWKAEMDLRGYLGAGDKWRFGARDLTESRPLHGPFNLPESRVWRQQAQQYGMKSKNADVLKIISHLMKKYNSCGMLKQLVSSLWGMLHGPVH